VSGFGNGGLAIRRDGKILTLANSGVTIGLESPLPLKEIPSMDILLDFVGKIYLPADVQGKLLQSIMPIGDRKYFNIDSADITGRKKEALLSEYKRILNGVMPGDEFILAAITVGTETYFLPEFYQIQDPISKAAILFHEGLWVVNRNLSYETVVKNEIALENAIRDSKGKRGVYDLRLMNSLKQAFLNSYLGVYAALREDLSNGPIRVKIPGLDGNEIGKITIDDSRPAMALQSMIGEGALSAFQSTGVFDTGLTFNHLLKMSELNKKLKFINELLAISRDLKLKSLRNCFPCEDISKSTINLSMPFMKRVVERRQYIDTALARWVLDYLYGIGWHVEKSDALLFVDAYWQREE
jgi:hypothetical protein